MDFALLLLIFLSVTVVVAWIGQYKLSVILFIIFLIAMAIVFGHHITERLPINL